MTTRSGQRRSTVRYTAGLLALGGVLAGLLNYLLSLVMTHHLAPDRYAVLAGAQNVLLVNGVVGGAGITWVIARGVAAGAAARRDVLTFGAWANVALGVVTGTLSAAVVATFGGPGPALVVGAAVFVLAVASTGLGVWQGEGRTAGIGAVFLLEAVVKFGVAVVAVRWGVTGALSGALVAAVVALVVLFPSVGSVGGPAAVWRSPGQWRTAVRFTALQGVVGLFSALDPVVVVTLGADAHEAGLYQVAATLGRTVLFVATALSMAAFPLLTGLDAGERRRDALRTFLLVGAFATAALVTAPSAVLSWVFPAGYEGLAHWLPWTAVSGVALGVLALLLTFLQAGGTDRRATGTVTACVVAVLGLTVGGALVGGVAGTATGFAVALLASAVALGAVPGHRDDVVAAVRQVLGPRSLGPLLLCVAALLVSAGHAWTWLLVALAGGLWTCLTAFPELRAVVGRHPAPSQPITHPAAVTESGSPT